MLVSGARLPGLGAAIIRIVTVNATPHTRIQAEAKGDADGGIWSAGQVVGLIDGIPTCAELMRTFMAEAEQTISTRLQSFVVTQSKL